MTTEQLTHVIRAIIGDVEIDAVQAYMWGLDMAEVKVRRSSDGQWFQGVMKIEDEP